MIEVVDFYENGAHVVSIGLVFDAQTFGTKRDLSEIGYSPKKSSKKTKAPAAHFIKSHGILVLNKGHKYSVKIGKDKQSVDAKNSHAIIEISDGEGKVTVKSGDESVSIQN